MTVAGTSTVLPKIHQPATRSAGSDPLLQVDPDRPCRLRRRWRVRRSRRDLRAPTVRPPTISAGLTRLPLANSARGISEHRENGDQRAGLLSITGRSLPGRNRTAGRRRRRSRSTRRAGRRARPRCPRRRRDWKAGRPRGHRRLEAECGGQQGRARPRTRGPPAPPRAPNSGPVRRPPTMLRRLECASATNRPGIERAARLPGAQRQAKYPASAATVTVNPTTIARRRSSCAEPKMNGSASQGADIALTEEAHGPSVTGCQGTDRLLRTPIRRRRRRHRPRPASRRTERPPARCAAGQAETGGRRGRVGPLEGPSCALRVRAAASVFGSYSSATRAP